MSLRIPWVQRPSWIKIFPQLVNKKSHFKEPKRSLSYSQELSTSSHPKPDESIPYSPYLFIIPFNIILSVTAKCSELFLSFRFAHKNPVCISLLFHSRHIPSQIIIFDLTSLKIFDERNKSWCLLSILAQPPVTSSRSSWSEILKYQLRYQHFPTKWLCNDEKDSKFDAVERRESWLLHEHVLKRVPMSVNGQCFVFMLALPFISTSSYQLKARNAISVLSSVSCCTNKRLYCTHVL